ncbi:FAD:protein FMN transferase [Candidatus Margulisiibacteriota bacterium]
MKARPIYFLIAFFLVLIAIETIYTRLIFSAERSAYIMGTPVRVKVFGQNAPYLSWRALWEIRKIDRLFSKFRPDSEISLINKLASQAPLEISKETLECLQIAQGINGISNGAFDITLGYPYLFVLNTRTRKAYIKRKGIKIDLGGIGKGYAVEAARRLLLKKGAKSGMIDMRSSIAVFGQREWQVGIQHPRDPDKLLGAVVLSNGQSLATSGDYERGDHIIDARIRWPVKKCQSVTVIGRNAAVADAISTAVFVLGPGQGMDFIESQDGIEGMIVDLKGKITQSSGFDLIEL